MKFITKILSFFLKNNDTEYIHPSIAEPLEIIGASDVSTISSWSVMNRNLYLQLEDKYYQYFIGVYSLLDVNLTLFEINAIESLEKVIKTDHSLAKDIPRLPIIVPKLLHLLKSDDSNWKEIANVIASDPVILVEVIKMANSAAYNLNDKDKKLESIIAQIGVLNIRILIMKVALKPIIMFDGGYFLKHSGIKIWEHSVSTAVACCTLAGIYKYDLFDAYLAGILNNLGMVIIVKKLDETEELTKAPRSIQFQKKLLKLSKQLSIKIANNWEMPPNIILALTEQFHNTDEKLKSALGDIVYEATVVSMEHILVDNNLWLKKENTDNKDKYIPYDKAYEKLDSCNF